MSHLVRFGPFEADLGSGQLRKHGLKIRVRQQAFEILTCLVEHAGQLVTREELQRRLWSDEVWVDFENNLNTAVAQLRQVLGDSAEHPRYIETCPRRGYRFIADVLTLPVEAPKKNSGPRRLLVLPFLNFTGDTEKEYFSDAMTDDVITAIAAARPHSIAVIARTTAMHYKGTNKHASRIARELKADYIVEGGVLRADDRIIVNVQLIQTSDDTHIFARKYDFEMCDLFTLYDSMAKEILKEISTESTDIDNDEGVRALPRRNPTDSLAAYNEYVKGRREMLSMSPQGIASAKAHFEKALARDPDFALAYCGFAQLYWYIGFWGLAPSRQTDAIGRFYTLRAIELDPTSAEAFALLSYYPEQRGYNEPLRYYEWQTSLKNALRALELNPRSQLAHMRHAILLMVQGSNVEAAKEIEEVLEVDPLSIELRTWFVEFWCLARQAERALQQARRMVEFEPEHFLAHFSLGQAYLGLHRFEEAVAENRRASELSGGMPPMLGWLGMSLGFGGHKEEAHSILDRLTAVKGQYVPPTSIAWIHLGLGNIDEAFEWMERAVDAPDRMMSPIRSYAFLDPYRDDPRFATLLAKMNLGDGERGNKSKSSAAAELWRNSHAS